MYLSWLQILSIFTSRHSKNILVSEAKEEKVCKKYNQMCDETSNIGLLDTTFM